MRTILFLTSLILSSCSSLEKLELSFKEKFKTKDNEPISFDLSRLEQFNKAMPLKEKFQTPFLSTYSYGDKKLTYLALDHLEGHGIKTLLLLKKIYADLKPQFVIVTGSAYTVISDQDDIDYALECEKNHFNYCNVDAYAIFLADDQDIAFNYGTPSDAAIHASIQKAGITNKDLLVFYTIKTLVQDNQKNKFRLSQALLEATKKIRLSKPLTELEFKKRFKQLMKFDFEEKKLSEDLVNPNEAMDPKWSNKLALLIETLEEKFLIHQIETRLNKYKNILVITSAHHLFKERKMLNAKLGEAIDSSI